MVETDKEALLDTDVSMEMEAEIEEIDEEIKSFKMNEFKIGNQNFIFNAEDPIFTCPGEKKEKRELNDCGTCKIVSLTKKTMVFCQFCGDANCKDCCNKNRFYPRAKLDNNGDKPRGRICKLCDRKFLVRAILLESQAKV